MNVIVADVLGMCFGVRDALAIMENVETPQEITIHGELVHNEKVLERLAERGFQSLSESRRRALPLTDNVLITAHGISERERRRLIDAGKTLIDTTCPLVKRAHDAAQKLARAGFFVLVIGKRGHVEVRGIVEDLENYAVIEAPEEVGSYQTPRLGVMCQTTTPVKLADAVREAIGARNPRAEIHYADTICHPTKDHQNALEQLMNEVDAMVVVGGRNSNNTRQLVLRCEEQGLPAYHVQDAGDLRAEWFDGIDTVGVTAGTSTLPETIEEVREGLERIHAEAYVGV